MILDKANELAREIRQSEEYKSYIEAKERIADSSKKALVDEYRKLRLRAQAALVAGEEDAECMDQLRSLGGLLQTDAEVSGYLLAEFRLSRMLGDVYTILADAAGMDTGMLDD